MHRFDGKTQKQIRGVPGTTSGRSIVNIRDYTFYFHRSGIYRYDGYSQYTSTLISRGIQEYIDGIVSTNYNAVVAWPINEEIYRCFVGNISNSDAGISLSNAYFDYDLATQTWSVGTYPYSIYSATSYIESQAKNSFFGTTTDEVYQDNTGNADGGTTPIEWNMETIWHFPFGTQAEGEFTRVQVFTKNGRGINLKYKCYGVPNTVDKEWIPLGDIEDYIT